MLNEAVTAIEWALMQEDEGNLITKENTQGLVDKVREYFNTHSVIYSTFSYDDLKPYL